MIIALIELLTMASATCIQTYFYLRTIGLRTQLRGRRLILVLLAFSVVSAALNLVSKNTSTLVGYLLGGIFFTIMILYPVLFMGGGRRDRILFGIVNCALYIFSGLLVGIVLNAALTVLPNMQAVSTFYTIRILQGSGWFLLLLSIILTIAIYAAFVLVIARLNTEGRRFMPQKYWTGMLIGFSTAVAVLGILNNMDAWLQDANQILLVVTIGSLWLLVTWFLLYFVFYYVCRYFTKVTESNMLTLQNSKRHDRAIPAAKASIG